MGNNTEKAFVKWWEEDREAPKPSKAETIISGISRGIGGAIEVNEANKNSLVDQAGVLDSLESLVRDETSLVNFNRTASDISRKMKRYSSLTPVARTIDQGIANMNQDYNMYTSSMEQGAKIIDDPNLVVNEVNNYDEDMELLSNAIWGCTKLDEELGLLKGNRDNLD